MKVPMRIASVLMICSAFLVVADSTHPAWKPAYPAGKYPPKSDSDHVWLHIDGPYIKRSPTCSEPNAIWQGIGVQTSNWTAYNEPLLDWVASHEGLNWMRLPWNDPHHVYSDLFSSFQDQFDNYIKPSVLRNKKNKIYTLIEFHYGTDPYETTWGYNPETQGPADPAAFEAWLESWRIIAREFKDEPWLMGYELYNEPANPGLVRPNSVLRKWMQRTVEVIREIDTNHIIVVPGVGSGGIKGNYFLWETEGAEWDEKSQLPDADKYDFGDPYNQTAIRYHQYMHLLRGFVNYGEPLNLTIPDALTPPSYYQTGTWGIDYNNDIEYYRKTYNLCIMQTEAGNLLGPSEWYSTLTEGASGMAKMTYANWVRWSEMEMFEINIGEKNFWRSVDAPKANKYHGIVSDTNSTIDFPLGFPWKAFYPGEYETGIYTTSIGETFAVAPEPSECDTCIPKNDGIAVSWLGGCFRRSVTTDDPHRMRLSTEFDWINYFQWIDIWSWAAKKAGSRPPVRSENPYVHTVTTRSAVAGAALNFSFSDGTLRFAGNMSAGAVRKIRMHSADGRLIYAVDSAKETVKIPALGRGVYLCEVKQNAAKVTHKLILK